MSYEEITKLLYKLTVGQLSETEHEELDRWVAERPEREAYIRKLTSPDYLEKEYRELKAVDYRQALARMEERIKSSEEVGADLSKVEKRSRILRIAAAIALLVVGGALVWYTQYTKVTPPELPTEVITAMQQSQQNGHVGAKIEDFNLNDVTVKTETTESDRKADDSNISTQNPDDVSKRTPSFKGINELLHARRVTTYHDKEFWLSLDDGTLVHLNYNTRVIYPEKFGRSKREVYLDGAAYFMVAKDRSRPFIVHTPSGDVKVYGTEFYASTHEALSGAVGGATTSGAAGGATSVILVKGSVGVTPTGGREQMMQPGQQCSMLNAQCSIENVDLEPYIAWNQGVFVFENATLERLMKVLSQWYGYEVMFCNDKARRKLFTGELDKYGSLTPVIEAIRVVTDVDISVKGNQIVIK